LERAIGSAEAGIANASPNLHGVPGRIVNEALSLCQDAFGETNAVVGAIVPALIALTSHAFKRWVAAALARITVAHTTIAAFDPGVGIIVRHKLFMTPRRSLWTRAKRAVDSCPLLFARKTLVAAANIALLGARSVAIAAIFTKGAFAHKTLPV